MPSEFKLTNPPPKRKKLDVPNTTGTQKMLLSGLDCLEGQLDLFTVDGYDAKDPFQSEGAANDEPPRA